MISLEEFNQKMLAFDNHWVGLGRSEDALREVTAQYNFGQGPGGATALLLLGESRVGKTHLLERFEAQHPPVVGRERDERPVIKVNAPHQESPKWLSHHILRAMNFPRPDKAAANSLSQDIIRFGRKINTRLIIVDEVHQLVAEKNHKPQEFRKAVSLLKEILNDGEISLVLAGTGNASVFSDYNTEFGERVAVHRINPYDWRISGDRKEFKSYVESVKRKLPLPIAEDVDDRDLAVRVFVASDGYAGRVSRLLREAAIWAYMRKEEYICREAFVECFDKSRKGQNGSYNPFKLQRQSIQASFGLL